MNLDQVYLDTLHEYLYCHRMLSEYGRYCYRVYRKIVRSHPHDHRAWDGLGQCCQYGYGTAPNPRRAKKYYKKAAKLANAEAQQSLGWLYESAAEPDYRHARKWYARAAAQCRRDATFAIVRLGSLHEHGLGGKTDVQAALKYYRRAAKLGDADAQNVIGFLYDTGRGVRQSYKRALKWYARAATGSFHPEACNNIGNLYHNGLGVKRDVKRAKHWYKLAARLGNEMAERNLALLQNEVQAAFGQ